MAIWVYIARDNIPAADRHNDAVEQRLAGLGEAPLSGRSRDELGPGLRSVPLGRYLLFYLPLPDGIELVRVLHGARDLGGIFGET